MPAEVRESAHQALEALRNASAQPARMYRQLRAGPRALPRFDSLMMTVPFTFTSPWDLSGVSWRSTPASRNPLQAATSGNDNASGSKSGARKHTRTAPRTLWS